MSMGQLAAAAASFVELVLKSIFVFRFYLKAPEVNVTLNYCIGFNKQFIFEVAGKVHRAHGLREPVSNYATLCRCYTGLAKLAFPDKAIMYYLQLYMTTHSRLCLLMFTQQGFFPLPLALWRHLGFYFIIIIYFFKIKNPASHSDSVRSVFRRFALSVELLCVLKLLCHGWTVFLLFLFFN